MAIRVQTGCGFKADAFSRDYYFQGRAVTDAAGAGRFTRMQDDSLMGRFFKCKGNGVEVVAWDMGNGWMSVDEISGNEADVQRFWQELERICNEVMPEDGAYAANIAKIGTANSGDSC